MWQTQITWWIRWGFLTGFFGLRDDSICICSSFWVFFWFRFRVWFSFLLWFGFRFWLWFFLWFGLRFWCFLWFGLRFWFFLWFGLRFWCFLWFGLRLWFFLWFGLRFWCFLWFGFWLWFFLWFWFRFWFWRWSLFSRRCSVALCWSLCSCWSFFCSLRFLLYDYMSHRQRDKYKWSSISLQ